MKEKKQLQDNNGLYNEILILGAKIEELKHQMCNIDTSTYFKREVWDGSSEPPIEYIPMEDTLDDLHKKCYKLKIELEKQEVKIGKINNLLENFSVSKEMPEEEQVEYQLFCREIFETKQVLNHNDPIRKYLEIVHLVEESKNWQQTFNNNSTSLILSFFGKTYVYKPKVLKELFDKTIFYRSDKFNNFENPTQKQIDDFNNFKNLFLYAIFDENIMKPFFETAKQIFVKEYSKDKEIYDGLYKELEKVRTIYEERLQNKELVKQLQSQIDNLTVQYEEKMQQFSNIESDNLMSNSKNKGRSL